MDVQDVHSNGANTITSISTSTSTSTSSTITGGKNGKDAEDAATGTCSVGKENEDDEHVMDDMLKKSYFSRTNNNNCAVAVQVYPNTTSTTAISTNQYNDYDGQGNDNSTIKIKNENENENENKDKDKDTDTARIDNDDADADADDDDDYFADVGFMFERNQPVKLQQYEWNIVDIDSTSTTTATATNIIRVVVHAVDDTPGAIQSGHYLWPGAKILADYLVNERNNNTINNTDNTDTNSTQRRSYNKYSAIIELGAGCALASLVALQLYSNTIQCILITDHDPGVLVRASDNYESTLQRIVVDENIYATTTTTTATATTKSSSTTSTSVSASTSCKNDNCNNNNNNNHDDNDDNDKDTQQYQRSNSVDTFDSELLNSVINAISSIPVQFEQLQWGTDRTVVQKLYNQMLDHINEDDDHCHDHITNRHDDDLDDDGDWYNNNNNKKHANNNDTTEWLLLGSDLIYCSDIVQPLFQTVSHFVCLIQQSQQQQYSQQHYSTNTNATIQSKKTIRFVLSQSFVYDEATEQAIDDACIEFHFQRIILMEEEEADVHGYVDDSTIDVVKDNDCTNVVEGTNTGTHSKEKIDTDNNNNESKPSTTPRTTTTRQFRRVQEFVPIV